MIRSFNLLARPYRWMEYLSFGRALERCRFRFLPDLKTARHALVLGDGDGRFAAHLLHMAPLATVYAIDSSPGMLAAMQRRCEAEGTADRLSTACRHLPTGLAALPLAETFDMVTTHFFLDCLSEGEVSMLVGEVKPRLRKDARWIVSEFAIPQGILRWPARGLIRLLYLAFRLLAGVSVTRLPNYSEVMIRHGFLLSRQVPSLGGVLLSEVWVATDS